MQAIKFQPGWVDTIEPGKPFRMQRGTQLKDQTSRKKLREAGELFTPTEVALRLRVKGGAQTIIDWIRFGDARGRRLGHYRLGRHYRISEAHLEEFLA